MPIFDPAVFDPLIFDVGEETPTEGGPPTPGGLSPFELIWDGTEIGGFEWVASGEEVVGGIGMFRVRVQDRLGSTWEPEPHTEVTIRIRASGWVLAHGESLTPSLDLPPGMPYRIWDIVCRDYNALLSERLIGAPPFNAIWRHSDREPYQPSSSPGFSASTDETTIQFWVDELFLFPGGTAPDTVTHVHEYIPNAVLGSEEYIVWVEDTMETLRSAVDRLAAIADVNIQDWLCPDNHWHHVHVPSWRDLIGNSDPTDLEDAPYAIRDLSSADGTTSIGHAGIHIDKDGQTMPEQIYKQGITPATIVDEDNLGNNVEGASGWYPEAVPDKQKRQAYLSMPDAWARERSNVVAAAAMLRYANAAIRMTVTVIGYHGEPRDGWRAGMLLDLEEARLPASMRPGGRFPIQSVAWSLVPGTDLVKYDLAVGDGALSRISQGQRNRIDRTPAGPAVKKPIITWAGVWVDEFGTPDNSPIGAGETRFVIADTRNALGEQWGPPGFPVSFVVTAYDADENIVPMEGSFSPNPTVTDQDGLARSAFTAGSVDGLDYVSFAETEFAP